MWQTSRSRTADDADDADENEMRVLKPRSGEDASDDSERQQLLASHDSLNLPFVTSSNHTYYHFLE